MQARHWVFAQKCPQPGQQPAVQNVFQHVPQPAPGSLGPHIQRALAPGSQWQSGQWMCGCRSMGCPAYVRVRNESGSGKTALPLAAPFNGPAHRQLLSLYPVRKIQPMATRQAIRKPAIASRLMPTLTSARS